MTDEEAKAIAKFIAKDVSILVLRVPCRVLSILLLIAFLLQAIFFCDPWFTIFQAASTVLVGYWGWFQKTSKE
jgi:hypothetical protein